MNRPKKIKFQNWSTSCPWTRCKKCFSLLFPTNGIPPRAAFRSDGVLFLLFDSLIQADFGDLSLHNIVQFFHILLRNCFADTTCQLSDDFYSTSNRMPPKCPSRNGLFSVFSNSKRSSGFGTSQKLSNFALNFLANLSTSATQRIRSIASQISSCGCSGMPRIEVREFGHFLIYVPSKDHRWVLLSYHAHLRLFLLLLLFHICWLAFAKCVARGVKAMGDENADLCFLSLIVLTQSFWADFGFGLFEQLCEHVAAADRFRCRDLFQYVSNAVLVDELLCVDHVPMALCPEGTFRPTVEWRKAILEGKVRLAGRPALALLGQFLADNRQKMIDLSMLLGLWSFRDSY